jgi:hypothetical protein
MKPMYRVTLCTKLARHRVIRSIPTHENKDWFHCKHLERLQQVAVCDIFEIDLVFVSLRVKGPVLCLVTELLCSARKQDRSKSLSELAY